MKKFVSIVILILILGGIPSFAMGEAGFLPSFGARIGADFGFTQWNNSAIPPRLAGGIFFDHSWVLDFFSLSLGTNLHFSTLAQSQLTIQQQRVTIRWHEFSMDIMIKLNMLHILYTGVGGGFVTNTPIKVIAGDSKLVEGTKSSIQPIFTWEIGINFPFEEINVLHNNPSVISLHIALRGTVNPIARKLAFPRISSIHSVGVYIGFSIVPSYTGP
ncbi:hypothetical protein PVA45_06705 [Entomospira entomophila]|uniref:Outer membrane protein beta-barrel domain-containing protein n=1 Tax=Entomospira entomophila TaxID=2719988 RepID=A0A968KWU9_9SPIO|nr:hypothetical protein [Entomospira entomophilus]NIZ41190.1 hypothetical protein [Entomospira entomophilus]WDI35397.1 hypothetical protein PVA45_06705 [Entomospira entomophilus]